MQRLTTGPWFAPGRSLLGLGLDLRIVKLGGGFKFVLCLSPYIWGNDPICAYFSDWIETTN